MSKEETIKQIHEAVLDMMSNVKMDKKHVYTNVKTDEWYQGVSEVSSIIPKPWLSAWGGKEAVKFLGYSDYKGDITVAEEMLETMGRLHTDHDIEGYIKLLIDAKGASKRKSKEALVDGKAGHEWLELYIKAKIRGTELPTIPTENLKRPLTQFVEWEKENVDYWILSEAIVSSPEKKYAGTLDGLAMMKTDKLSLIDFKFASHISEDYYLQTAGYQYPFEKYGIEIQDRIIVRLPKTLTMDKWDETTHTYSKVENTIEVLVVPTDYKMDIEVFLHALPLKKWINLMENNKKII